MTYYSYRNMLNSWLDTCDIRDEHGRPVHLTPHQWRHTFVICTGKERVRYVSSAA